MLEARNDRLTGLLADPRHFKHTPPGKAVYTIRAGCFNCHMDCVVTLPKGLTIGATECPHCGCTTLISKENM